MNEKFWVRWPDKQQSGMLPTIHIDFFNTLKEMRNAVIHGIHKGTVTYLGSAREFEGEYQTKIDQIQHFKKDIFDTPFNEVNQHLSGCRIGEGPVDDIDPQNGEKGTWA